MPWVEVITREAISQETKAALAKNLSDTVTTLEVNRVTDGGRSVDWMWFRVLPETDWAVGGEFGGRYVKGRLMCFAHVIAPEGILNAELRLEAIGKITGVLRDALQASPDDDGTGIFVIITEVPLRLWGISSGTITLQKLVDVMEGDVSPERMAEAKARDEGWAQVRKQFGIPI